MAPSRQRHWHEARVEAGAPVNYPESPGFGGQRVVWVPLTSIQAANVRWTRAPPCAGTLLQALASVSGPIISGRLCRRRLIEVPVQRSLLNCPGVAGPNEQFLAMLPSP